jgi:tetratricopeptide (TPR) repeat protein
LGGRLDYSGYRPGINSKSKKRILLVKWIPLTLLGISVSVSLFFFLSNSVNSFFVAGDVQVDLRDLWQKQAWEELISYSEKELEKNPLDPKSLYFAGVGHFYASITAEDEQKNQNLFAAIKKLRRLLVLDQFPLVAECHLVLGKSYYFLGRYYTDLSIRHLEEALRLGYTNNEIWGYLGLANSVLENYERSAYYFERALNLQENDLLRWSLAYVQFKNKNYEESEKNLQITIMNTTDKGLLIKSQLLLAEIYFSQRNFEKAQQQYDIILQSDPNNSEVYFFLGEIYNEKGEPERARSLWRRALQLDPYHYNAALRLRGN